MADAARMLVNGAPGHTLAALDRGLAYGDGLFETIRFVQGRSPLWPRHMQRLRDGAELEEQGSVHGDSPGGLGWWRVWVGTVGDLWWGDGEFVGIVWGLALVWWVGAFPSP